MTYTFREYPKWIHPEPGVHVGSSCIVENAQHEQEVLEEWTAAAAPADATDEESGDTVEGEEDTPDATAALPEKRKGGRPSKAALEARKNALLNAAGAA